MSAPTPHTAVATGDGGGGRLDSLAGADPEAVLTAFRSSIFQVCKEQISAELKRLQPVLASGSPCEVAEALRAASLVVDEAAEVIAEADAVLRLRGLAGDDTTGWSRCRDLVEIHIKQFRILKAAMDRDPQEERQMIFEGLEKGMSLIIRFANRWCSLPTLPACFTRPPSTPAVVDDLASGIEAVQVSPQE